MTFLQLDTIRFIQVYIGQGLLFFMFAILLYLCLRKGHKRPFFYFTLFYLNITIALFINFVYAPLKDENLVIFLNFLTNFLIFFSMIFLTVFCLSVYKQNEFGTTKQISIIIIYAILILSYILIPNAVVINETTNWTPHWNPFLFLYLIIINLSFGIIPTFYYSFKLYSTLNDSELKKRWKYFIISILLYYIAVYSVFIANTVNNHIFRIIAALITVFFVSVGHLMIYFGVIKKV